MKKVINTVIIASMIMFASFPLFGEHVDNHVDINIDQIKTYGNIDPQIRLYGDTAKVKIKLDEDGTVLEWYWVGGNRQLRPHAKKVVLEYLIFDPIRDDEGVPQEAYAILPLKFQ